MGKTSQKSSGDKLQQKVSLELEKQEKRMKLEELLYEEAERRRIYEKYLLKFQHGSSVLTDFHTNQF